MKTMHAEESYVLFPCLILLYDLCRYPGVPADPRNYTQVYPTGASRQTVVNKPQIIFREILCSVSHITIVMTICDFRRLYV